MATSAMTFGLAGAIQDSGNLAAGRISAGEYLAHAGISAAGGAAGSLADFLVSTGMAVTLQRNGWMTAFGEYTRKVAASTAFAWSNTGVRQILSTQKMSATEFASQLLSSFLYNVVSSGIDTLRETAEYKERMNSLMQRIQEGYSRFSDAGLTPEQKTALADEVIAYTQQLRSGLNEIYLPGQQKYVDGLNDALSAMEELMNAYRGANQFYTEATAGYGGHLIEDGKHALVRSQIQKQIEAGIQDGYNAARQLPQEPMNPGTGLPSITEEPKPSDWPDSAETMEGVRALAAAGAQPTEVNAQPAATSAELPSMDRLQAPAALRTQESGAVGPTELIPEQSRQLTGEAASAGTTQAESGKQALDNSPSIALEQIEARAREAGKAEGIQMEPGQIQRLIESYSSALEENDNAEFLASARGQIRGLQDAMRQKQIEAGDDLGLAEDLGRIGIQAAEAKEPEQPITQKSESSAVQPARTTPVREVVDWIGNTDEGSRQESPAIAQNGGEFNHEETSSVTAAKSVAQSSQRDGGMDSRGQVGSVGEGTGGSVSRSGSAAEIAQLRDYVQALGAERVSARELGIQDGTKNAANVRVDVEAFSGTFRDRLDTLRQKAEKDGVRLDFVIGSMEVRANGQRVKTSGVMQIDADGAPHAFLQIDSRKHTPETIYDHEVFHSIVAGNKGLWRDIIDHLYETHTEQEIASMVAAYAEAYDGCYGFEDGVEERYLEEIFADVYAEMQRGGGRQRAARSMAEPTAQSFAGDIEKARQNRAGIENRNGPGTRLSIQDVQGQNGDYTGCVVLDTNLFDGIPTRNWGSVLQKWFYNNYADRDLTIYDEDWYSESVLVARLNDRVTKDGAKNSHKVINDLTRNQGNNIKNLAVAHLPELLVASSYDKAVSENSHQWMDANGWTIRKAYLCDLKGKIYEATLNIAEARDGRRIIYDISLIKEIDKRTAGGNVPSTVSGRGQHTSRSSFNTEGKEALVDKLNEYASAVAKAEATKKPSSEVWVNAGISATKAGVKLEEYIVFSEQLSKVDGKDSAGESVDGLRLNRQLALLNNTGWSDKQKEIVFLESSMTKEAEETKEKALRKAGLTWRQTSDVMGTVGSSTDKAYAIIHCGASSNAIYEALEVYLDGSTLRTAQVGIDYNVDLRYWASARKEASTDGNDAVSQKEATEYIDKLDLGLEDKAYLWQMICYGSKWMKNPYSTTLGKEIWQSLHPDK